MTTAAAASCDDRHPLFGVPQPVDMPADFPIQVVTVVDLKPGDRLIVRLGEGVTPSEVERLVSMLKRWLGPENSDVQVLIIPESTTVEVIRAGT